LKWEHLLGLMAGLLLSCYSGAWGQEANIPLTKPAVAVVVLPDNLEYDMTVLQHLLQQAEESSIKRWAQTNGFVCVPIKERHFALLHSSIARPLSLSCQTLIDIMQDNSLKLLSLLGDKQIDQLATLLQSPNFSHVTIPNLKQAVARGTRIGVKPLIRLEAIVDWDERILRISMADLTPLANPKELPQVPEQSTQRDNPSPHDSSNIPLKSVWRVMVLDSGILNSEEQAELTAIAFQIMAEEVAQDRTNALNLFDNWRQSIAGNYLDADQMNWVSWDMLPADQKAKLREALIGQHLDEQRLIDARLLDSADWAQKARVRFQITTLLQMLITKTSGEAILYLIPIGNDGGALEVIRGEALETILNNKNR